MAPDNATADSDDVLDDVSDAIETEPIVDVFSRPANVRILLALADAAGTELAPGDIIENAGVSRNAWYDNKDRLIDLGLIEPTRTVGNAQVYRARMDGEPMQGFVHLYDALGAAEGSTPD